MLRDGNVFALPHPVGVEVKRGLFVFRARPIGKDPFAVLVQHQAAVLHFLAVEEALDGAQFFSRGPADAVEMAAAVERRADDIGVTRLPFRGARVAGRPALSAVCGLGFDTTSYSGKWFTLF